jgi:hypothetical protein
MVEFNENHESGLRFYFRETQGTPRDTQGFGRAPKNRFLTICTCFHDKFRKNHESGRRFYFRGTPGSSRDTLGLEGAPKNQFLDNMPKLL